MNKGNIETFVGLKNTGVAIYYGTSESGIISETVTDENGNRFTDYSVFNINTKGHYYCLFIHGMPAKNLIINIMADPKESEITPE